MAKQSWLSELLRERSLTTEPLAWLHKLTAQNIHLVPPGASTMTKRGEGKCGCMFLSCRRGADTLHFLSCHLHFAAPLGKAELLSLASCGESWPGSWLYRFLSETFMRKGIENKSHCPPSLRDSPSPLSLLKSHGINFCVHWKAK